MNQTDTQRAALPGRPLSWALAAAVAGGGGVALAWGGMPLVAGLLGGASVAAAVGFGFVLGRERGRDPVAHMLRAAVDGHHEGRAVSDGAGNIVYANAAFRRLFPLPTGRPWRMDSAADLVRADDDPQRAYRRLLASAASAVPDEADLPLDLPTGNKPWRRVTVAPLPGAGDGPLADHALWQVADVTRRRQKDQRRHREDRMVADFLDHMPSGFFSADADGNLIYANQTLADWLGVDRADLAGRQARFADFVVAEESLPAARRDEDGEATQHGEVTLRAADGGTFRACLVQSEHLGDDGQPIYSRSMVLRDVVWRNPQGPTPEALLHGLFDTAPVGIVQVDLNGDVTDCNRTFLKLLGLHSEAVVGRAFCDRLVRENRDDVNGTLSRMVMGTLPVATMDVRFPGPSGHEVAAELLAGPLLDGGGEVGLILHVIDATAQKNLEVQVTQSQKMQAVGQLAGGVAHDFNNLLTAMIGFCDLLLERHGPRDPSHHDLMQIKKNAGRATNLVRQLLAFSRKQTLRPEIIDPNEALSDLSNLLRRLIGETIDLRMELGRDLGRIQVDPGQFDQVVINLVVNARDAMPRGGRVTIRSARATLETPVDRGGETIRPGDYVVVAVADTGCGIAKEDIDKIFEPFFSTKDVGAGTGLGLATVYGIIHQSGGHVLVDSAIGEGTEFTLYLPRQAAGEEAGAAASAGPPRPTRHGAPATGADLNGQGRVLLVEDEDAVRLFGARALRAKGYDVLEAADGERALDVIKGVIHGDDQALDLIVSDVVMPGMDGHTLVRLVRQELPQVRVILISGYAEDALSEDIARDPSVHFLPKPFSMVDLAGKVKDVLAG